LTELLLLRAEDAEDLRILSACVQDMAVKPVEVAYQKRARRLVLVGNRYRWEAGAADRGPRTRVRSALRFEGVLAADRREWPEEMHAVLPLLAVTVEDDGRILLSFGGGTVARLTVEAIDVTLEDLSGPWGALGRPDHASD
jgi:hypothetical protein